MRHGAALGISCLLAVTACSGPEPRGDERGHHHGDSVVADDHATVTRRFEDASAWAERFEDPERDAWQEPERVVEVLDLAPDARVADIGAATGYFPVRFARAAPEGVVYGVDVEPGMVNYLNLRALREGLPNLVSLVCHPDDPLIPEPVDVVFICDTFHHIGDRVAYFRRVREEDLAPGGRLVVVDFRPGSPMGPPDEHKLPAERVVSELEAAGFRLARREELTHQYLLVFE